MPLFSIHLSSESEKFLQQLKDEKLLRRIESKIDSLAGNPEPSSSKQLSGTRLRRVRVGDYRIIYDIIDNEIRIQIIIISHRKDVYKRLKKYGR